MTNTFSHWVGLCLLKLFVHSSEEIMRALKFLIVIKKASCVAYMTLKIKNYNLKVVSTSTHSSQATEVPNTCVSDNFQTEKGSQVTILNIMFPNDCSHQESIHFDSIKMANMDFLQLKDIRISQRTKLPNYHSQRLKNFFFKQEESSIIVLNNRKITCREFHFLQREQI